MFKKSIIISLFLFICCFSNTVFAQEVAPESTTTSGVQCAYDETPVAGNFCPNKVGDYLFCTVCSRCGDGVTIPPEECDDGQQNSSSGACNPDCTKTYCGDGITQDPNGFGLTETCDLGDQNGTNGKCSATCQSTYCGDGIIQTPNGNHLIEECDNGNANADDKACNTWCEKTFCGDGIVQRPNGAGVQEECDGDSFIAGYSSATHICQSNCKVKALDIKIKLVKSVRNQSGSYLDANSAPGPQYDISDQVYFQYKVMNTGTVDLRGITVTDDILGDITNLVDNGNGDNELAVGEVWFYESGPHNVINGQYKNIGTASGSYHTEVGVLSVHDTDPAHYNVSYEQPDPGIRIKKYVSNNPNTGFVDANSAPGVLYNLGDDLYFRYIVTNTGNVDITDTVSVSDSEMGDVPASAITDKGNGDDVLNVGESWTYQTGPFAADSVGNFSCVGSVFSSYRPCPPNADPQTCDFILPLIDEDPVYYEIENNTNPKIRIKKYISDKADSGYIDANSQGQAVFEVGDKIYLRYIVTNTGDVNLVDITITDDKNGVIPASAIVDKGNGDNTLNPGESWTYQYGPIELTSAGDCSCTSSVTAYCDGVQIPVDADDTDPVYCKAEEKTVPKIKVKKYVKSAYGSWTDAQTGPGVMYDTTDILYFRYIVKNTGNVNLVDVVLVDSEEGTIGATYLVSKGNGNNILEPGEEWIYVTGPVTKGPGMYHCIASVTAYCDGVQIPVDYDDSDPVYFKITENDPCENVYAPVTEGSVCGSWKALDGNTHYRKYVCFRESKTDQFFADKFGMGVGTAWFSHTKRTSCWSCACGRLEGCFAPETLVRLADGSEKAISEISAGEEVYNPLLKRGVRVERVIQSGESLAMIKINAGEQVNITVTQTHPFLTTNGVKRAIDITLSDRLVSDSGDIAQVSNVEKLPVKVGQQVINLVLNDVDNEDSAEAHYLLADGVVTGDLYIQEQLNQ